MVKKKLNKKPRVQENNLSAYNSCWCSCTCSSDQWGGSNYASNHQSSRAVAAQPPTFNPIGPPGFVPIPVPYSSEEAK